MAKVAKNSTLYPPFGVDVKHRITQTYHDENGGIPKIQTAIDVDYEGKGAVGKSIYCGVNGKVVGGQFSGTLYDRYIAVDFGRDYLILYVHVDASVKLGDTVKRGQKIGVCTTNHLHVSFKYKPGTPEYGSRPPGIMNYWYRADTLWYATDKPIVNVWCLKNKNIDWRKFPQKWWGVVYVEDDNPDPDPCSEIEKAYKEKVNNQAVQINELQAVVSRLKNGILSDITLGEFMSSRIKRTA